ncbi:hypothetical protein ACWJJH_02790 [Endozoicomonadaceae bacterium StTr2]
MHPALQLQLLNLRSPSWQRSGAAYKPLQWEDVAAALGMGQLPPIPLALARAKFCDDRHQSKVLLVLMTEQVLKLAEQESWRCRKAVLVKLAQLACHELLSAHHCKQCGGRGITRRGLSCSPCRGKGRIPMTTAARYRFAAIDKRNWDRRWNQRYEQVYNQLCEAENQLLGHLARQLNGRNTD